MFAVRPIRRATSPPPDSSSSTWTAVGHHEPSQLVRMCPIRPENAKQWRIVLACILLDKNAHLQYCSTHGIRLEYGQRNTGHIVLLCADLDLSFGHILQHHLIEVTRCEFRFGQ